MKPEYLEAAVSCDIIVGGFVLLLLVGAIFADYIVPRIPFLSRFLDRLPDFEDEDDAYKQYLDECCTRRRSIQRKLDAIKGRR